MQNMPGEQRKAGSQRTRNQRNTQINIKDAKKQQQYLRHLPSKMASQKGIYQKQLFPK
jgi:hypothetical protein